MPTQFKSPHPGDRPGEKEFVMCHAHWARRRRAEVGPQFNPFEQPGHGWGEDAMRHGGGGDFDGGPFGVRRPLRFLAHKLELTDPQIAQLAKILDELKTERAQSSVDDRRSSSEFADALTGESFDAAKAAAAGDRRVQSATHLRDAVVKALGQIHAMLQPEQREKFSYLIRAGVLAM